MSKDQHPLCTNALSAIRLGVLDFGSGDPERAIAAARHVHAGLLLLYKEKLRQLSPPDSEDALLKERVIPVPKDAGEIAWVGRGKRTANRAQIEDRLKSLGVAVDWKRFDKIAKLRNELEHYHALGPAGAIGEVVANAFVLVRDFLALHLQLEPLEVLGDEVWTTMLDASEVFEKERVECLEALQGFAWETQSAKNIIEEMRCGECESSLIVPTKDVTADGDPAFKCRACGSIISSVKLIETALDDIHGGANYESMKDGGELETDSCPECGAEAFVYEADECACCGYEREYTSCDRCGTGIGLDSQILGGLCSYCHHVMTKDD